MLRKSLKFSFKRLTKFEYCEIHDEWLYVEDKVNEHYVRHFNLKKN